MRSKLIIFLLRLLAKLPLSANHLLGGWLGRLFVWIPNREREVAEINLRHCFPDLSEHEVLQRRNHALIQAARTIIEFAPVWLWDIKRLLSLIKSVENPELMKASPGQGIIALTPHLGCWELAGLYLAEKGPLTILYRPPKLEGLEQLMRDARARNGACLATTDASGVKQLYKALKAGEIVGILPDQEPDSKKGAEFAPFFGVNALTMLLVNRLVRKTGAKVVFGYMERLPHGKGFIGHFMEAPEGVGDADPSKAARALNEGVERCVSRLPEQYQWSYKRFKTQPDTRGFYRSNRSKT